MSISSLVLPRLTVYNGTAEGNSRTWSHLDGLELADPDFLSRGAIELLLGADVYAHIALPDLRRGGPLEPIAQQTQLGWILLGPSGTSHAASVVSSMQCSTDDDLTTLVRRFWEAEEPPHVALPPTADEQECEEHFIRTHLRIPGGRYQVSLPVRPNLPNLSVTRRAALRMLDVMERRFGRDQCLRDRYREFMAEYHALGHMSPATTAANHRSCFLPHHGVWKGSGQDAKIRVVFNGSSRTPEGISLNQVLHTGPNLLPALSDVLTRWRRHRYVFLTDIEKMYRQILVHPDDRDLQRVLWRQGDQVREFRLNTVTYGLASAPYLAIRVLHQLADDEGEHFPLGSEALKRDTYMDDILTGAAELEKGRRLQKEVRLLCRAGGFPLRKWAANHPALLDGVPEEHRWASFVAARLPTDEHSVLGLRWSPANDDLAVSVRCSSTPIPTKRSVLSQTARLFDPLGWLAPIVIRAKLLVQTAWLQHLEWDAPLAAAEAVAWNMLEKELLLLEAMRVPRWFGGANSDDRLEIHGFSDASERAYAAVVYFRMLVAGTPRISLVMAKTKVAPLKRVSLPRLELCAAALLAKLSAHLRTTLGLEAAPTFHWSDSMVALSWIRSHPAKWTTYVANRVADIQRLGPEVHWRHIPGRYNDCASRGASPMELLEHPLWWHGPGFLRVAIEDWPTDLGRLEQAELPERRPTLCLSTSKLLEPEELRRFSSMRRLLRVSAWMQRWRPRRLNIDSTPRLTSLSPNELDVARVRWIRVVQALAFPAELRDLRAGRTVAYRSILHRLNPIFDEDEVLRVGGRIKHSLLDEDQKQPIILPPDSHLTQLVIDASHRRMLHGGTQATLAAIRQQYWIPRGRQLVRRYIHRCPPCVRWRAATPQPLMGSLPRARVTPSRPFLHTGVDFAGPILLRTSRGRGHKAYKAFLAVFICFSSRAVHLEVVSDYSADAFLAAFRRFVSRRGLCRDVYSDCGTNFVGADSQLRALFQAGSRERHRIMGRLADEGIRWHFNPPAAPHFGGLWEAAVKSVKHHLRRVIGESRLTYEERATFLAETEACLNSRPLQALTDDPEDLNAMTPGHFLMGSPLTAIPKPSLLDVAESRLSRWRLLQSMRDHLWQRWSREYLQTLTPRPKWWTDGDNVSEGQLCLLKNETTPPCRWALARITRLNPGEDGLVRVVDLKTATGQLTRPTVRVKSFPCQSPRATPWTRNHNSSLVSGCSRSMSCVPRCRNFNQYHKQ